jgi:hypothetical protein
MATHAHDWIEADDGTASCGVAGCRALRHEHRYIQDTRGRWSCVCGAWTPKPPPPPERAADLSAYNVRPLIPRKPRMPRSTRKPMGSR